MDQSVLVKANGAKITNNLVKDFLSTHSLNFFSRVVIILQNKYCKEPKDFLLQFKRFSTIWKNPVGNISRVFLLRQLWIIIYFFKSQPNNLSNENINTGNSVVFNTKHELKCQYELVLKYYFSGNTSIYVFITEII